ncbi:TetR/AcrR family transcriptional regulator [Nonomuraea spiralis]|uniref:TetR/AcrR family transcriptional regulator n=1 Tax=Nonomuraea spiralis TaxID=46182 RepID=A0ABV5IXD3_9ACTN|nr:TetR/AcrR family transcriptional regulator [Nonomuraea spiralis]GGS83599.1 TetR family transcriptional regulator [Nonomuraea spiralis]
MANAPRRARRTDAARNARLLLSAAKELFAEHGPGVALDDVARRAGLGNATLYRHFPTRTDLIVAVYADEVTVLCDLGARLLDEPSPGEALFTWLDAFVAHISDKRALALAGTDTSQERRAELFRQWHDSMRSTADKLLMRAQRAGEVRTDLTLDHLLALTNATAIAGADANEARHLLHLLHHGFTGPTS